MPKSNYQSFRLPFVCTSTITIDFRMYGKYCSNYAMDKDYQSLPPDFLSSDHSDCESIDSDTRYEMEIALYSQIHHEVNDSGNEMLHNVTVETATEKNHEIIVIPTAPIICQEENKKPGKSCVEIQPVKNRKMKRKEKNKKKAMSDCLSEFLHRDLDIKDKVVKNSGICKTKSKKLKKEPKKVEGRLTENCLDKSSNRPKNTTNEVILVHDDASNKNKKDMKKQQEKRTKTEELFGLDSSDNESEDVICLDDQENDNLDIQLNNIDVGTNIVLDSAQLEGLNEVIQPATNWNIIESDRYNSQIISRSRYFIECMNCRKKGHLSKYCPLPKKQKPCLYCGESNHMFRQCPNSLCYNCYKPGHEKALCPTERFNPRRKCTRCQMPGHSKHSCTDIWRQYHVTTEPGAPIQSKQKQNKNVMCCNCGKRGHFIYDCRIPLMDSFKFPYYPFTAEYDTYDVYRARKRKHKSDSGNAGNAIKKTNRIRIDRCHDVSEKRTRQENRKLKKLLKMQAKFENSFQGKKTIKKKNKMKIKKNIEKNKLRKNEESNG
ncbi:uncharacterized protein LOC141903710 isoform X2 [Tubulanus polymorphus]|uniref:uncharacterized protein LOC141903710 isoform X2 n=1 Tax=Tubulanus polymorphus TaxID=672921 RepID=UPI003DA1D8E2